MNIYIYGICRERRQIHLPPIHSTFVCYSQRHINGVVSKNNKKTTSNKTTTERERDDCEQQKKQRYLNNDNDN